MSNPQIQTAVSSRVTLSIPDLISTLVEHGCPDVTARLDTDSISQFPIRGGGFGDIYFGRTTDGQDVAIKCARYRVQDDQDRRDLTLMAREIHVWSKCHHINVLELFGLAQHRGQLAIVSPWMENGALPDYIVKSPDVDRLVLSHQITKGLAYLHRQNMVHGDLKGANILVSSNGTLKLTDFGNTKLKEQTLQFSTRTTPVYSLRWAAPEILKGSVRTSPPADIYALGMTIYETATGNVPYADKSDMTVMAEVLNYRRFPARNDAIVQIRGDKDWLWDLMRKCWDHNSARRLNASQVETMLAVFSPIVEIPIYKSHWNLAPTLQRHKKVDYSYGHNCGVAFFGDGTCGKTYLILAILTNTFPEHIHIPPLDPYVVSPTLGYKQVEITVFDVYGQEDYERLHNLYYEVSRLILICFDIGSPDTLSSIQERWVAVPWFSSTDRAVVLIGCKKDLRDNPKTIEELRKTNQHPVIYEEGAAAARNIGAQFYLECSSLSGEGIQQVRDHIASMALFITSDTNSTGRWRAGKSRKKDGCIVC